MPAFVHIDHDKIQDILNSDEGRAFLAQGVASAVEIAKVGTPEVTSEHRDAIVGYVTTDEHGDLVGIVGSTSKTWHLIEFGSYHNSPTRSMTHGVEAVGIKFTPVPPGTKT